VSAHADTGGFDDESSAPGRRRRGVRAADRLRRPADSSAGRAGRSALGVAPKGPRHSLWGGVTAVDAAAGVVVVTDHRGYVHRFRVAAKAPLTKGGDRTAIALSDLSAGARVRVSYVDDVAVAVHVRVAAQ
jgi:hypothetical protein